MEKELKLKEHVETFRNWIEETLGKRMAWSPVYVGTKGGRKLYAISFEDGTEKDYIVDFDNQTVEQY